MPGYTLEGEQGPVRLADVFAGKSQLIVHNHMWFPGEQWQCPGCTGFTSQFSRLELAEDGGEFAADAQGGRAVGVRAEHGPAAVAPPQHVGEIGPGS
jgi:hypothetical protein